MSLTARVWSRVPVALLVFFLAVLVLVALSALLLPALAPAIHPVSPQFLAYLDPGP